jgi:hypothetical protein
MRVLREGATGDDVYSLEYFLCGRGFYIDEVDADFNDITRAAVIEFQKRHKLGADGVVGNITWGKMMQLGLSMLEDDAPEDERTSANWPGKPEFSPLSGNAARQSVFGPLEFKPAGSSANPEAITITNNFRKQVEKVPIPQLQGVKGTRSAKKFWFHKKISQQMRDFFKAVDDAGLLKLILGWAGSWSPRFIRGSRSILSNHAFATAFDINVPQNWLGSQPALVGKKGSVRELVPIAHEFGLYWGGHFKRKDGMHFEAAVVQ